MHTKKRYAIKMIIARVVMPLLLSMIAHLAGDSLNKEDETQQKTYKTIHVDIAKLLFANGDYTLIDVRSPEEYNEDHIMGAHLIPCDELETRINELNKNEKYIIICRSGNRSTKACDILMKYGFKNVLNIEGGMEKWYNQE